MVLTWRAAALAAATVLGAVIAASWWAVLIGVALLIAVIGLDLALCPSPSRVHVRRSGDTSVRLGEQATTWLTVTNTGRKTLRALVRNAWVPSAGARNGVSTMIIPARQRRTAALPWRPAAATGMGRWDRAVGPLGIAGRRTHLAP
jgi:uncharacterized protein (DUF58 family)